MVERQVNDVFAGFREPGAPVPTAPPIETALRTIDEALCQFERQGSGDEMQSERQGAKSDWLAQQLANLATWIVTQKDLAQDTKARVDQQAILFKIVDKPRMAALTDKYGLPYRGFQGDPQNAPRAPLHVRNGKDTAISVSDWYTYKPQITGSRPA